MSYTRHFVEVPNDDIQYCVYCGEIISDTGLGFPEGEVFVSTGTGPKITTAFIRDDESVINCE